jgi:succinate dehydrogenase / fumarate reductase cytochrome b subunit
MRIGMYAWLFQRISGIYMVFFLVMHIGAIAQATIGISRGFQAEILDVLRNPFYYGGSATAIFDLIALAIIAFHGINGVRIVFLDLGLGVRRHRLSFMVAMTVAVASSAIVIILGIPLLISK